MQLSSTEMQLSALNVKSDSAIYSPTIIGLKELFQRIPMISAYSEQTISKAIPHRYSKIQVPGFLVSKTRIF